MLRFLRQVHYNTWFMTTCCNEPAAAVDEPQTQLLEAPSDGEGSEVYVYVYI